MCMYAKSGVIYIVYEAARYGAARKIAIFQRFEWTGIVRDREWETLRAAVHYNTTNQMCIYTERSRDKHIRLITIRRQLSRYILPTFFFHCWFSLLLIHYLLFFIFLLYIFLVCIASFGRFFLSSLPFSASFSIVHAVVRDSLVWNETINFSISKQTPTI